MTLEEYKEHIETMLGAPILDIEVHEYLDKIINAAFREIREYIDTPHYQTIAVAPTSIISGIDVSQYKIRAILYITRGTINWMNATENTDALLWSPLTSMMTQTFTMGYGHRYSQMDFLKDYGAMLKYRQLRNTLSQDLDFTFDSENQKLYFNQQIPQASQVTLVYNKRYDNVEEINDHFWQNLLLRMSLAYTKQVLGRIRGKYKLTSAPYELDADTMLSEANDELAEIRQFLNDNNNIFIPRD